MHPNLRWGASPDGLVRTASGEQGLLEVKCFFRCRGTGVVPQPTECPDSFYDQIQGHLEILTPTPTRTLTLAFSLTLTLALTLSRTLTLALTLQGQLEILGYDWCDLMLYTTPRKGQVGNRNSCVTLTLTLTLTVTPTLTLALTLLEP